MSDDTIEVKVDTIWSIIAFVKNHERNEIPDDVWDTIREWEDELDNYWYENQGGEP